jgi:hypothetical protein
LLNFKKIIFKSYTGHSNDINTLEFIDYDNNDTAEHVYFVSSADNDRIVNVWEYSGDQDQTVVNTSYISFLLNDNPVYMNASRMANADAVRYPPYAHM